MPATRRLRVTQMLARNPPLINPPATCCPPHIVKIQQSKGDFMIEFRAT